MQQQFWVIGADYADASFTSAREGSLEVLGPFEDRAEATRVWREQSEATRYRATTRYTIAASRA